MTSRRYALHAGTFRRGSAVGGDVGGPLARVRVGLAAVVGAVAGAVVPVGIVERCALAVTGAALASAAHVDVHSYRLPNPLVASAGAAAILGAIARAVVDSVDGALLGDGAATMHGDHVADLPAVAACLTLVVRVVVRLVGVVPAALVRPLVGAVLAGLPVLAVRLVRGVGMGDVKAAAVIGASAALVRWWAAPVAIAIAAAGASFVGGVRRRSHLALGPFLAAGWWVAVELAAHTADGLGSRWGVTP